MQSSRIASKTNESDQEESTEIKLEETIVKVEEDKDVKENRNVKEDIRHLRTVSVESTGNETSKVTRGKREATLTAVADPEWMSQLREWIDDYEDAVTNHYSPELKARLSGSTKLNGMNPDLRSQNHKQPKCRVVIYPDAERVGILIVP